MICFIEDGVCVGFEDQAGLLIGRPTRDHVWYAGGSIPLGLSLAVLLATWCRDLGGGD